MTIVRNTARSKSGLFLLELMIAIVFFALSSVICIQLFVKAHTLSQKSGDLNMAVIQAQNAAEAFKACGGDADALAAVLEPARGGETDEGIYMWDLFYASDWQRAGRVEDASYVLHFRLSPGKSLHSADISVFTNRKQADGYAGEKIYGIAAKSYSGTGVAR